MPKSIVLKDAVNRLARPEKAKQKPADLSQRT